jgi:hypothetical protein
VNKGSIVLLKEAPGKTELSTMEWGLFEDRKGNLLWAGPWGIFMEKVGWSQALKQGCGLVSLGDSGL